MTLAVRLKKARLSKKITQEELAETVGIKQQAVQRIEAGKVKSTSYVVQLAKALEVTPEWLALGEVESTADDIVVANTNDSMPSFPTVPLLQWHDIDLVQQLPLADKNIKMLPVFTMISEQCFALQINDYSMLQRNDEQNKAGFSKGSYIIVDRKRTAQMGDYVIATIGQSTKMTFRQLQAKGTKHQLEPLNPQYNAIPLSEETNICGVVILHYTPL